MPATARLSSRYHGWFSDDVPAHIVDQFNAALEEEGAAIRSELRQELQTGLAKLRHEMKKGEADLLQFLFFIYWISSIMALGAFSVLVSGIR